MSTRDMAKLVLVWIGKSWLLELVLRVELGHAEILKTTSK